MIVAVVVDKPRYVDQYNQPVNPYDYALETGLERVYRQLETQKQLVGKTSVIAESRGQKEDSELELAFRRIADGNNATGRSMPFHLTMVKKAANSAGLQLADLMARPIALKHFRPNQDNRAYDIIEPKIRRNKDGKIEGWGIKRIP
jgi:hypothetical protein